MKDLIQAKLKRYESHNAEEELMALKEITQELVLYGLQKADFFRKACFLGGTCLRILHGVQRFSEDLDFSTNIVEANFNIEDYLNKAMLYMRAYGYELSMKEKDLDDKAVKSRFLKDSSIKKVLSFKYKQNEKQKIKIKIEIDTNPPAGAKRIIDYVDFPEDFAIATYDLPSLMAGKIHALLCRPYAKGRDWFDFLWYLANNITPNYNFLEQALQQHGPWENKIVKADATFITDALITKIKTLETVELKSDINKFLTKEKAQSLDIIWSTHFFEKKIIKLRSSR